MSIPCLLYTSSIAEFLQRDDGQIPAAGAHQAVHRGGGNPGTVGQFVVANIAFSAKMCIRDRGDVAHPGLVGAAESELALEQVWRDGAVVAGVGGGFVGCLLYTSRCV